MPIFVFDVETTGLDAGRDRIIEFGGVAFNDEGEVIGRMGSLVNPNCHISPRITEITGITNEMVRNKGVPFSDIAEKVHAWMSRAPAWGGQNIQFDLRFVQQELLREGIGMPEKPYADTLTIARRFLPKSILPKKNLGSLTAHFNVPLAQAHRATDDAEATGHVLFKMAEMLDVTLDDLVQGHAITLGPHAIGKDPFDAMFQA